MLMKIRKGRSRTLWLCVALLLCGVVAIAVYTLNRRAAAPQPTAAPVRQVEQTPQSTPSVSPSVSETHSDPSSVSVLINKKHPLEPLDFAPGDLVSYGGYLVSAKMEPSLTTTFKAAATAGVPMGLSSTYRPYDGQVVTYNHWVAVNGSTAAADTVSARPGYSEHQTGFAADLEINSSCTLECFADSAQYKWLVKHAADYGFIERYPAGYEDITGYSPEAWHWRYVGKTVAKDMKAKGVKTLEQYWNITGGDYAK